MKHFPILQARAYVVELPEGHQQAFEALKNGRELTINRKRKSANVDHITFDFDFAEQLFIGGFLACTSGNLDTGDRHYLFGLGWQIVGMLPGVTESEAADIVEYTGVWLPLSGQYVCYMNYVTHGDYKTALESLESAVVAEGYTFSNPLGVFDDFDKQVFNHSKNRLVEWQQAQSRVLCRERCLVLRRVEG